MTAKSEMCMQLVFELVFVQTDSLVELQVETWCYLCRNNEQQQLAVAAIQQIVSALWVRATV